MKRNCSNLLLMCVFFAGLVIDAAAQNNEYTNFAGQDNEYLTITPPVSYAGRTTLRNAMTEVLSWDEDRFYDVEGTRYLIYANVTQAVRRMSDKTRSAMSLWKSISNTESQLDASVDEVEVVYGEATLWMPIGRAIKSRLLSETQPGSGVYLLIRTIGRKDDTPIFFIEYYRTVEKRGLDRVLRDAVECATTLKDFTESLDIIEEIGTRWSHTADWTEEKHTAALSYIRGLASYDIGEYEIARKYLHTAERYIHSHPDDELSEVMTAGVKAIGREGRK